MNAAHQWQGLMPMNRPLAYCCSRFRAADELEAGWNRAVAVALTRYVALHGWAPITPHLYLPLGLDDGNAAEREIGLACGLSLVRRADVFFCYRADDISEGMGAELALAGEMGLTIHYIDSPGELGLTQLTVDSGQLIAGNEKEALTTENTEEHGREVALVAAIRGLAEGVNLPASWSGMMAEEIAELIGEYWENVRKRNTALEQEVADAKQQYYDEEATYSEFRSACYDALGIELGEEGEYSGPDSNLASERIKALRDRLEVLEAWREDNALTTEKEVAGFDGESALVAAGRPPVDNVDGVDQVDGVEVGHG